MNGPLRVPLGKAQRLHGSVLAITLAALDADVLGLQFLIVVEEQPAILVPEGDALVHSVVPSLEALDGALWCSAKHGGKVLLDALPLELLVVPGVDDKVALLSSVLLVDVSVFAIRGRAGVAVVGVHERVNVSVGRVGLLRRVGLGRVGGRGVALNRGQRLGENRAASSVGMRRGGGRPGTNLTTVGSGEGFHTLVKFIEAGEADVGVGGGSKTGESRKRRVVRVDGKGPCIMLVRVESLAIVLLTLELYSRAARDRLGRRVGMGNGPVDGRGKSILGKLSGRRVVVMSERVDTKPGSGG